MATNIVVWREACPTDSSSSIVYLRATPSAIGTMSICKSFDVVIGGDHYPTTTYTADGREFCGQVTVPTTMRIKIDNPAININTALTLGYFYTTWAPVLLQLDSYPASASNTGGMTLKDAVYLYGVDVPAGRQRKLVGANCDVFQLVLNVESGYTNFETSQGNTLSAEPGSLYRDVIRSTDSMFAYMLYEPATFKSFSFFDNGNPTGASAIGKATIFGYCLSSRSDAHVYFDEQDKCLRRYSNGATAGIPGCR